MPRIGPVHLGTPRLGACLAAVATLVGLAATPARAQVDPMEEQRCVWRCLADSRGASDPAYHACVQAQCVARPPRSKRSAAPPPPPLARSTAAPRGNAWKTVTDLPYPAVAQCLSMPGKGQLCLVVSCPARGGVNLELYGLESGLTGAPARLAMQGALFDLTMPPRAPEEDAYRWPMPIGLAPALKAENEVELDVNGRAFRLPLAGSAAAIGEIETRCQ